MATNFRNKISEISEPTFTRHTGIPKRIRMSER